MFLLKAEHLRSFAASILFGGLSTQDTRCAQVSVDRYVLEEVNDESMFKPLPAIKPHHLTRRFNLRRAIAALRT
jgi:hypothetical protein